LLRTRGQVIVFEGHLALSKSRRRTKDPDEEEDEGDKVIPPFHEGETLLLQDFSSEQKFTEPPPRYTEGSLVRALEEKGIGRPSTYAPIIGTIQDRKYVQKEKGRFAPTDLGELVVRLLIETFPDIFDVLFTAGMEEQLDDVEEGRRDWVGVLREFYTPFSKRLEEAPDRMSEAKRKLSEELDEKCPECGKNLAVKWGRYGKFIACSGYPDCTYSRPMPEQQPEETDEKCPKCGKPMVIRRGRYGPFLACTGYPECKEARPIGKKGEAPAQQEDLGPCPKKGCDGNVVRRRSRKNRTFYGCSRYPDCDFVSWGKPIGKPCPECGAEFLVEKHGKKGARAVCANRECDYSEDLPEGEE